MSAQDEWKEWMNLAINDLDEARGVLDSARDRVSTTYNAMPGNAAGEPEAFALRDQIDAILEQIGLASMKAWTIIALISGDSQSHDDDDDEEDDEDDDLS